MRNYLTFDLEYWYDSEYIHEEPGEDFVIEGADRVLVLLDKYNTKATFFVTGKVLERYPEVVKKLHEAGHEIASHSYEHKLYYNLKKNEAEKQLRLSKNLIKKTIGINPKGFRAPCYSISKKEFWIYDILNKLGFNYSSSLFPVNMGLFGSSKFPNKFFISENRKVIEFPVKAFELFKIRIPFATGFTFRVFPRYLINLFMKRMNRNGQRVLLSLHPWEFCPEIPRLKLSLIGKVVTYWGLKNNESKLDFILSNFKFIPLKEGLKNERL